MNLFSNTRFSLPEEDRLTAALLCVLEHTNRRLLVEFAALCNVNCDSATANSAEFDVQVPLPQSRPDAVIRLRGGDLVIEAKHTAPFDASQFARHAFGLASNAGSFDRPILVALTGNPREQTTIRASVAAAMAGGGRATAVTWWRVAALVSTYAISPDSGEATRLLAAQFRDYLKDLGYAHHPRQRVTMKALQEAAAAVCALRATATAADDTLKALMDALKRTPGGVGLRWQIDCFRGLDFRFLDTQVRPAAPLRLRVVPYADGDGVFRLKYYLTFAPAAAPRCAEALAAGRADLRKAFGEGLVCDTEKDGFFRVLDHLPHDVVERMYAGDEGALSDAADAIGRLFASVRQIVETAL